MLKDALTPTTLLQAPSLLWKCVVHLRRGTFRSTLDGWLRKRAEEECASRIRRGVPWRHSLAPGVEINLHPEDRLSEAICVGKYEATEQRFVRRFLKPGDVFVDVGANVGLFTLLAAERVKNTGRVFAFEPSPTTFQRLQENVRLNRFQNVRCERVALSDDAETRTLTTSVEGYGAWDSLGAPSAGRRFTTHAVSCCTWDDFACREDLVGRVTLMKLDVEGWESRVLRGGRNTLARADSPDLLVEFTDANAQAVGGSCSDIYRSLEGLGYRIYRLDGATKTIRPDPLREEYPYVNLCATKDVRRAASRSGYAVMQ
jgi:FkbM family methyltransferase